MHKTIEAELKEQPWTVGCRHKVATVPVPHQLLLKQYIRYSKKVASERLDEIYR